MIAEFLSGIGFVGDNWIMRRKMIKRGKFSGQIEMGRAALARHGEIGRDGFARQVQDARGEFARRGEWF